MPEDRKLSTVLMTVDTLGGVWTYACELVQRQSHLRIVLACMGPPPSPAQREAIKALPNAILEERTYALEWMQNPWAEVDRAGQWLLELEQRYRPDLIHLNGYTHASLPWQSPCVVVAHSCVNSWWRAVHQSEPPPEYGEYTRRVSEGLKAAALVIAPSQALLDQLRSCYRVSFDALVIANGRSGNGFRTGPKENLVLACGRLWDEAKNIRTLAEAATQIESKVVVAGECSEPFPNVTSLGRLSTQAIEEWYARASIFAHPALYEPFGLAPLEAALSGCALVLGDISSLCEIWQDAAIYVDPRSPRKLADAVNLLLKDSALCSSLASKSIARARQFPSERMVSAYSNVYAQAMLSPTKVSCAS